MNNFRSTITEGFGSIKPYRKLKLSDCRGLPAFGGVAIIKNILMRCEQRIKRNIDEYCQGENAEIRW